MQLSGDKQGGINVHGICHFLQSPQHCHNVGPLHGIDYQELFEQADQGRGSCRRDDDIPVQNLQLGFRLEGKLAKHQEIQQTAKSLQIGMNSAVREEQLLSLHL